MDLLDPEGRIVSATFTLSPPPGVLAGQGPVADAFVVMARSARGDIDHESVWGILARCDQLWRGRLAPADRDQRRAWYLRGVVRQYRREFHELLTQDVHERVLDLSSADLFRELDGDAPLDRIESEIEDYLLEAARQRIQLARIEDDGLAALIGDVSSYEQEWEALEPWLRERRDERDPRFAALYPRLDEFYRELEQLRPFQPEAVPERRDRMERLIVLGNLALQALTRARQQVVQTIAMPERGAHDRGTGAWPREQAVHVHRLVLEHLRCLDEIDLELTPPLDEDKGQWLVFLGENGTGKTTILRALALALEPRNAANLHLDALSRNAPLVRHGARKGHVSLSIGEDELAAIDILAGRDSDTLDVLSEPEPRPLVFGYGCRRGSALGGPSRESKPNPLAGADTLFDENAYLVHADTWLRDLLPLYGPDSGELRALRAILKRVLDIELTIEPETTWIQSGHFGRVRMAALSDGYITTLGWIVDFVARWVRYARTVGYTLNDSFHLAMPAVVLIDEIDLHLHPRWQSHVIDTLRATFPRTTFIATTHNPLTLSGLRAEEIVRLQRDDDGAIRAIQPNVSPTFKTGSELYETFFGIDHYMPAGLDDALLEYATLAGNPRRSDDDDRRMRELGARLEDAGVRPMKPISREVA